MEKIYWRCSHGKEQGQEFSFLSNTHKPSLAYKLETSFESQSLRLEVKMKPKVLNFEKN